MKQNISNYIKDKTGITPSKKLLSFIAEPSKLHSLNNVALKEIVIEYAPIFNKFRGMLDDPLEAQILAHFEIYLLNRIAHKPDMKSILYKTDCRASM